ncbi:AAA family ATPase, partial [Bacteroides caecigallinarum]|uniref:AAA family ATPase n=1 Tax=Bacteroides caecigallinarum TaxID=1411144 RepID=UPI001F472C3F
DKSMFDLLIRYTTPFVIENTNYEAKHPTELGYAKNANFVDPTESLSNVCIDAYGTNRHSESGTKRTVNSYNSETLFGENNNLTDIEYWILQLDIAKQHKRPGASGKFNKVRNMIRHSNLFPGIKDIEIGFDNDNNSFVYFISDNGRFRLNELGYGYQCMFSWIFDFCKKMFDRYPNSKNPLHEPAILLVDEIDMHLHPSWQRLILSELCNMFPMTQFIVTTHSPLIVQSMKKINLYVLSNKSEGVEIRRYRDISFQGWTVEEILRELMDLGDDVRSDEYIKLIDKFKSALQSGNSDEATLVYEKLSDILHPNSIERELYPMQIEGIDDKRYD